MPTAMAETMPHQEGRKQNFTQACGALAFFGFFDFHDLTS
jgi:hypothetical protein